jgi:hypothetical protein
MTDDNKIKEYRRMPGIKENYVHEKAYESGLLTAAFRRIKSNRRYVKRYQVPEGKFYRTVKVTNAQYKAYMAIYNWCTKEDEGSDLRSIHRSTLETLGIRVATIKALEKLLLITEDKDKETITLYTR